MKRQRSTQGSTWGQPGLNSLSQVHVKTVLVGFEYSHCTVNSYTLPSPLTGTHIHSYWGAPGPSGITAPPPPPAPPTLSMMAPTPPTQLFTAASDSPGPSQQGVWHCLQSRHLVPLHVSKNCSFQGLASPYLPLLQHCWGEYPNLCLLLVECSLPTCTIESSCSVYMCTCTHCTSLSTHVTSWHVVQQHRSVCRSRGWIRCDQLLSI